MVLLVTKLAQRDHAVGVGVVGVVGLDGLGRLAEPAAAGWVQAAIRDGRLIALAAVLALGVASAVCALVGGVTCAVAPLPLAIASEDALVGTVGMVSLAGVGVGWEGFTAFLADGAASA